MFSKAPPVKSSLSLSWLPHTQKTGMPEGSQRAFDLRQPCSRRVGVVDSDDVAQCDTYDRLAGILFQLGLDVLDRLVAESLDVFVVVGLRIADGHQHEIGVIRRPLFKREIYAEWSRVVSRE